MIGAQIFFRAREGLGYPKVRRETVEVLWSDIVRTLMGRRPLLPVCRRCGLLVRRVALGRLPGRRVDLQLRLDLRRLTCLFFRAINEFSRLRALYKAVVSGIFQECLLNIVRYKSRILEFDPRNDFG